MRKTLSISLIQCELKSLAVLPLTSSPPEPGPNPGPSPCVLILIWQSSYPRYQSINKNSPSHKLLRFSKTLTDSSMDHVLSVVRAQYYLPHLSILSSTILPNPLSRLLHRYTNCLLNSNTISPEAPPRFPTSLNHPTNLLEHILGFPMFPTSPCHQFLKNSP